MTAPAVERQWWVRTVGGSTVVGVVAGFAHPFIGLLLAFGVVATRLAALLRMGQVRRRRYDDAFLSFLEATAAHLRSGTSLIQAFVAAPITEGRLAEDRSQLMYAYELGTPFSVVCSQWRALRPSEPVVVGTVALAIAYEHGAAVAAALEHLALTVRDRAQARQEVRTQALHARLSAYVISAAPAAFLVISAGLDPRFLGAAFSSAAGRICIVVGLGCEVLGWVLIAWIVRDPDHRKAAMNVRIEREIPITTDLVGLGLGAGHPPIAVVGFAREWCPPLCAGVFAAIERRLASGDSLAQALANGTAQAPALGGVLRVLLAAANGAPVQMLVARLADDARVQLKVAADARARAIPIRLLFPLVLCILPAFALLTVAPAVLAGLQTIH